MSILVQNFLIFGASGGDLKGVYAIPYKRYFFLYKKKVPFGWKSLNWCNSMNTWSWEFIFGVLHVLGIYFDEIKNVLEIFIFWWPKIIFSKNKSSNSENCPNLRNFEISIFTFPKNNFSSSKNEKFQNIFHFLKVDA